MKVAIIAITKHGVEIARRIKAGMPEWQIYTPAKFKDNGDDITWYNEPTPLLIGRLFREYNALVCIFSLGAAIRMLAPHLKDKKSDPAVVTIDDKAQFVISTLSGHLGGANTLARLIASKLNATPVITTAADVNETIAVDLFGREFNWIIDDDRNVTMVSAYMVNEEKIGIYQDSGEKSWQTGNLPSNVILFNDLDKLAESDCKGALIITHRTLDKYTNLLSKAVVYRPKSLVIGLGLHVNTSKEEIERGIKETLRENNLSFKSISLLSTLKSKAQVKGLQEFLLEHNMPIRFFEKDELSKVEVPNPSDVVKKFEGTASVAEAAALLASKGRLIVEKRVFPPNLTVAIAEVIY